MKSLGDKLFYCLFMYFLSIDAFGEKESKSNVELYSCVIKRVSVTNVAVSPNEDIFDDKGNRLDSVRKGLAELIFSDSRISISDQESKTISDIIERKSTWKHEPKSKHDSKGVIVGLHEDSIDRLVLINNKWRMLRIYSNRVIVTDIDLVYQKDSLLIAAIRPDSSHSVTNESNILREFQKIIE